MSDCSRRYNPKKVQRGREVARLNEHFGKITCFLPVFLGIWLLLFIILFQYISTLHLNEIPHSKPFQTREL